MKVLHDRVAVVTGAGGGIGRATCVALAERGVHVAAVDVREDTAEDTAQLVRSLGRRATVHLADVRDADAMRTLADEVVEAHGECHVLVNNAGVTSAGGFEAEPDDDLRWIVDINVWGVVNGCRAFLPELRRADEAHIVNLSSMVGLLGLPHNASYSLTKGAVRSFSEALRAELITSGIGVTAVFPGAIDTGIMSSARGSEAGRLAGMTGGRLSATLLRPPSAVARAIVRGIEKDRARVVVGPDAHLVSAAARLLPGRSGLVGRLTNRLVSDQG
jgi:NAD(P)-dependent dehydrogenase (short-subunit alcohol dehydrogenase family)